MGAAREDDRAGVIDLAAFERDGAIRIMAALSRDDVERLRDLADSLVADRPGVKVTGDPWLADCLSDDAPGRLACGLTSSGARPVRAVMFDKSDSANWSVAWHQDRTIPVRERIDTPGYGPWSTKDGAPHVAPPFEVLARMVTLRLHLDDVERDNAPLRVALGSHRLGVVAASEAERRASEARQALCLASTGDVWAYSTPILHASHRAARGRRRRVLQVDYADFDLPGGLRWRGLAA